MNWTIHLPRLSRIKMSESLLPLPPPPPPICLHGACKGFTLTCINIFGILLLHMQCLTCQGTVMQEHLFGHLAIHMGHAGQTAYCRWVSTSLYLSLLTVMLLWIESQWTTPFCSKQIPVSLHCLVIHKHQCCSQQQQQLSYGLFLVLGNIQNMLHVVNW